MAKEELIGIKKKDLKELFYNARQLVRQTTSRMVKVIDGIWIGRALQVSKNHHKLDSKSARFSLCPMYSCPSECLGPEGCANGCYGIADEKVYKTAYNKDLGFTYLALNDIPKLEQIIVDELCRLTEKGVDNVRIHERGDFVSQEYLDMWVRISRRFPWIVFYCFTKTRFADGSSSFDWSGWDALENTVWHSSYDPFGAYNFGDEAHCEAMHKAFPESTYMCPFHMTHKKCGLQKGSCKLCLSKKLNGKTPVFLEHKR